jgi:hypothetical protein
MQEPQQQLQLLLVALQALSLPAPAYVLLQCAAALLR